VKATRPHHDLNGRTSSIIAVGSHLPAHVLTNADLERMVETSDDWIMTRTGIKERRIAAAHESTSDLAAKAALKAMAKAGITADQIDLIIVATVTPDMLFPSTACLVQHKIGAMRAVAFDIEAACSGFIYGLEIARQFIGSQTWETVLVIGADKLSSIVDWTDRNTCVLFGDGAAAAIVQHRPDSAGVLATVMGADGSKGSLLCVPAGGSRLPASTETLIKRQHFIRMNGKDTFKNAVQAMHAAGTEVLRRCGLTVSDIACVIPHQANGRIIEAVAERLGLEPGQLFLNVERYGNTSAASVAIALDEAVAAGRVQRGDLVLLLVFGAGFTWAAAVLEW
jgi:3-oxoacyl-[acyl-carrier-protein] synthase-3